ncbi:hypothetical protein HMPREF0581_0162 [Mogibacterium timidum ATCC 33093]|uniref:Uncharacterized protein n=1 Tax=Mogibacterium timidum ATCC 33093 TaxID=1401079 RepID=X8J732_9FIRM|nr:hypothetical protein HMPREF0581_0162 [Mogibacterium timidum ATCC 33093]
MLLEIQQIIYMIKYNLKRRLQSGIGRDYRPLLLLQLYGFN